MNTNKKGFTNILFIILLIVIGIVGYLFLSKQQIPINKNSSWINKLIKEQENSPVANPPASLAECKYKNQTVYYLPPRCCDIESVLYNKNGNTLCSPDGGFTGKGDGKCPDFFELRKNCRIVWQDNR